MQRRTLFIILGVLGIVLVGVIGLALAFVVANPGKAATSSATPVPTGTVFGTATTQKIKKINGVIQSLGTQSFVIKAVSGKKTTTITVDNRTKYSSAAGSITFSDLQVGDSVQVRGTYDQTSQSILAQRVTVEAPTGSITAITSQNPPTLTLSTSDNKTVTLHMTAATSVVVANVPVSHSFLVVGQMISYTGSTGSDGSVTATVVYLDLTKVTGTVNGLSSQNVLSVQPTSSAAGAGSSSSPVSVNLTNATVIAQSAGKKATGTPTVANETAIKMSANVVVYDNSKVATGTPTAVLVIVGA